MSAYRPRVEAQPRVVDGGNDAQTIDANVAPCPFCGEPMCAVRGSKHAVCSTCGFKDSCCY